MVQQPPAPDTLTQLLRNGNIPLLGPDSWEQWPPNRRDLAGDTEVMRGGGGRAIGTKPPCKAEAGPGPGPTTASSQCWGHDECFIQASATARATSCPGLLPREGITGLNSWLPTLAVASNNCHGYPPQHAWCPAGWGQGVEIQATWGNKCVCIYHSETSVCVCMRAHAHHSE